MTEYRIRPLVAAKIGAVKGVATHMVDMMTPVVVPVLAFYIEGGPKKILVDTGVLDAGPDNSFHGFPLVDSGPQGMINALAEIGLKPEDIDIVIITHLHFDHAANISLFPNAQFILQKKEWEYAKAPLPVQRDVYLTQLLGQLEKYDLVLADDGYEVADGINVICVPGHTKGQQAVIVNTSDGNYVIAGDLMYTYLNMYPERTEMTDMFGNLVTCTPQIGHAFYPPGIHTDLSDWYDSVWRVLKIAGSRKRIIPGHDPALMGKIFPEE
ncbi:Beta-lactamase-like [Syntrophomonas zehnderi OL-4]|uniref:Beta-lactamase-like n=1 Tax=Syntrophomonas zehnderi OL-4 TaxID=690567 RepID=A0A0E4GAV2_9FIRM|nr:N-acyl homoserine lactonase family protein [Syntrophomonas zehnderi]CFX46106.1 Beta-lactamase-like [Syntrophomonas zehnderi OL-4]